MIEPYMHIRDLAQCKEIIALDQTVLRELLHPDTADVAFRYSLAHAAVQPGLASKPHKLSASEVYYILEGEGIMHIDGESSAVAAGQAIYIPPHGVQHIENTGNGDLKFLCIVDPAWRAEDEELLVS